MTSARTDWPVRLPCTSLQFYTCAIDASSILRLSGTQGCAPYERSAAPVVVVRGCPDVEGSRMQVRERWRHFLSQRPRWRLQVAWLGALLAVLLGALAFVPASFWQLVGDAGNSATGLMAQLGDRAIALGADVALLVISIVLFTVPRGRTPAYLSNRPGAIASTSVYLDAENQATSPQAAQAFVTNLRAELGGKTADLIYYADSMRIARSSVQNPKDLRAQQRYHAFRVLYRFGFRPVDVFHRTVGVSPEKNIVDIELALHAYQRALIGPGLQEIHLVSADGDFVPLIYRLKALGHTVHLWADVSEPVSSALTALPDYLDVKVHAYGTAASRAPIAPAHTSPHANAPERPPDVEEVPPPTVLLPPVNQQAVAILEGAVSATLERLENLSAEDPAATTRESALRYWLNGIGRSSIEPLGYPVNDAGGYWLAHLKAFAVLTQSSGTASLSVGSLTPHDAAVRMELCLRQMAWIAHRLADDSSTQEIKLNVLGQQLDGSRVMAEEVVTSDLHELLHDAQHLITHMRCFMWCGRALGLVQFQESKNLNLITLMRKPPES